ncbi:MAG: hypothetical protein JWN75_1230 [Candidatus Saccharibacteria bacterium]|nr:hypothetical protein [Candidatus Saccharibacteria bacterium]
MTLNTQPLWDWVNERHAIYHRKLYLETSEILPESVAFLGGTRLTQDKILSDYRFCNVFRELDRVTVWIRENIREPYADHPNLWIMLAIARTINWPPTLAWLIKQNQSNLFRGCWPDTDDFQPSQLYAAMEAYKMLGNKVYTGAYMIRAESNQKAEWFSWPKQRYVAEIVIGRLWETRDHWQTLLSGGDYPGEATRMEEVWQYFQSPHFIGWGPFMAYQVCVDLRWTRYLSAAPDIQTWAAVGPGSRRGLNRLAGRPVDYVLPQRDAVVEMRLIHREQPQFRAAHVPPIDLSDIQNCLCETDKYLRVALDEGRPRAKYIRGRGY